MEVSFLPAPLFYLMYFIGGGRMKGSIKKIISFTVALLLIDVFLVRNMGMDVMAVKALDVMFIAIFLWMTEIVHSTITAMLIFCLIPTSGILPLEEVFIVMGDTIIWRLVGIFIITIGMEKTGFARRVALEILSLAKGNLHFLLFLMEILTFIFVFLVPAVAARTAILAAICMGLVQKIENGENANFARASSIIIPVVSLISSGTIMVGASATIYAAAYFQKNLGYSWTYLSWMKANLPINIVAIFFIYIIIVKLFPFKGRLSDNLDWVREEKEKLGKISKKECKLIIIIALLFIAWFEGIDDFIPVEFIAGTLMFLPGIDIIEWKETFRKLEWGTVILFGSGLAMAQSLAKTKAVDFLVKNIAGNIGITNEFAIATGTILITALVRLGMANMTGVVATLLPVFTSISRAIGINPQWTGMICVLASELGILTPSQSSSNLTTYVYGYYKPRDLFKAGFLIIIAYIVIIAVMAKYYWPVIGLGFKI
ncbi:MAG: solute carrier family 13 (sodium-dependent dicarboxylate transporter), er 2/3/5 [Thermoanaerobacteraceae bacterium]|nr:solute carrier family 13 (sodium-dependent dicarboxylate transporter), er 2/3/5 [Thermoanaerobacteraceae bacterium]